MKNKLQKLTLKNARTISDLLVKSDINAVIDDLAARKAQLKGLVIIGVTRDLQIFTDTAGLHLLEALGLLLIGKNQILNSDYCPYHEADNG